MPSHLTHNSLSQWRMRRVQNSRMVTWCMLSITAVGLKQRFLLQPICNAHFDPSSLCSLPLAIGYACGHQFHSPNLHCQVC